jgi:hypothetical protein
VEIT